MGRGNPDNLRAAAKRKQQAAIVRATTALDAVERDRAPVTFRGLAQAAGVSVDFLYRSPLRARVEQLRSAQQRTPPDHKPEPEQPSSQSSIVRTLTTQLTDLKRHHRAEITRLEMALAAAHGENLQLRRQLGRHGQAPAA
jgi:hypothetical protein